MPPCLHLIFVFLAGLAEIPTLPTTTSTPKSGEAPVQVLGRLEVGKGSSPGGVHGHVRVFVVAAATADTNTTAVHAHIAVPPVRNEETRQAGKRQKAQDRTGQSTGFPALALDPVPSLEPVFGLEQEGCSSGGGGRCCCCHPMVLLPGIRARAGVGTTTSSTGSVILVAVHAHAHVHAHAATAAAVLGMLAFAFAFAFGGRLGPGSSPPRLRLSASSVIDAAVGAAVGSGSGGSAARRPAPSVHRHCAVIVASSAAGAAQAGTSACTTSSTTCSVRRPAGTFAHA